MKLNPNKTIALIAILCFIAAFVCFCQSGKEEPICGADSDAHGCKGSAGYVWSEMLQECVRPWETGEAVAVPQEEGNTHTKTYHIVFSADSAQAELIGVSLLERTNAVTWTGDSVTVIKTPEGFSVTE